MQRGQRLTVVQEKVGDAVAQERATGSCYFPGGAMISTKLIIPGSIPDQQPNSTLDLFATRANQSHYTKATVWSRHHRPT